MYRGSCKKGTDESFLNEESIGNEARKRNAQIIPIGLKKGLKQKKSTILQLNWGNERFEELKGKLIKQH